MSTHLLYTAETRHSEGDYLSALEYFDKGIKELEKNHRQSDPIWAWAWAHMGESHLAFAQTLDHLNPAQDQHYNLALYCFNKAVGVREDKPENPKIKLDNEDLTVYNDCDYAWAFAHRGETLRTIANNWPSLYKAERYEEAIKCFEKAISLEDAGVYIWAHAHLGATVCNTRGWDPLMENYPHGRSSKYGYQEAMWHLDKALEATEHNYPWCLAYKGVVYIQQGKEQDAIHAILAAIFQDTGLVNFETVIRPPWEFGIKRDRGMRYSMSLVEYLLAKSKTPKTIEQQAYELFYNAVRINNTFWRADSPSDLLKMQEDAIQKARDAAEKIKPGQPDEDKYYILGGLLALEAGSERSDWERNMDDALGELEHILDTQEPRVESLKDVFKTFRNQFDHLAKPKQPDKENQREKKVQAALDLLQDALKYARENGGEALEDTFKAAARGDRAWYYLRNNKRLIELTQHEEEKKL